MEVVRRTDYTATRGDRVDVVKHEDHLKMEGVIDIHRSRDDYKRIDKTEKIVIQKHEDNLRTEGEFIDLHTRNDYSATKGERASVVKPQDNLKPDGKFYKPEVVPTQPAEKRKPFKHVDNITIERDLDVRQKQKIERVDIIRREDNLKIEGEFIDMKQRNDYSIVTGERTALVKHEDNLKMEGRMENIHTSSSDTYRVVKGQRVKLTRREDNLKIEGVFEDHKRRDDYKVVKGGKTAITYYPDENKPGHIIEQITEPVNGEKHIPQKPDDRREPDGKKPVRQKWTTPDRTGPQDKNFVDSHSQPGKPSQYYPEKPEDGKPSRPSWSTTNTQDLRKTKDDQDKWQPGERPEQIRPKDNLYPEGDFIRPSPQVWQPGDRRSPIRPKDHEHTSEQWQPGDRQNQVQPGFEQPKSQWQPGERPEPIRPKDNLKPEGDFDRPSQQKWQPGDRPDSIKPKDNLHPERVPHSPGSRMPVVNGGKDQTGPQHDSKPKDTVKHDTTRQVTDSKQLSERNDYNRSDNIIQRNFEVHSDDKTQKTERATHVKHTSVEHSTATHVQKGTHEKHSSFTTRDVLDHKGSQTNIDRSSSQNIVDRTDTQHKSDRTTIKNKSDKNLVNKVDSKNYITSTNTTKTMKQVTEKKLIAGKWVTVTRNVEVNTIIGGDTTGRDTKRITDDQTTHRSKNTVGEANQNLISSEKRNITTTSDVNDSRQHSMTDNQSRRNISNTTYIVRDGLDDQNVIKHTHAEYNPHGGHLMRHDGENVTQKITSSTKSSSSNIQNSTTQKQYSHTSSENRTQQNVSNVSTGIISDQNVSKTTQHVGSDNQTYRRHGGDSNVKNIHSLDQRSISEQRNITTDHHAKRSASSINNVISGSHTEQNVSRSSHQSQIVNRSQLSDSVTKTSIEFQRAMHGGSDSTTNIVDNSVRSGHHKRTSDLVSDAASSNAVLHRKGVSSATEAHHSISSTAAAQRKSIGNLCDRGEYISNSTQSTDRKSISSMHRSNRENMAVISQQSESSDSRRQQRRDGQSTLVVERQPRVTVRDNLRVGGEFYGQSEAKAYGSFSRSEHAQRSERSERVERVERHTRHGNTSHFVLGDGGTSYKREFTTHVHGTCPATLLDSSRTPFKHTRDSREHKFYSSKVTQQ